MEKSQQGLDKLKKRASASTIEAEKEGVETQIDSNENDTNLPQTMYTLKFNSPILPYAKFPLTQNKYI